MSKYLKINNKFMGKINNKLPKKFNNQDVMCFAIPVRGFTVTLKTGTNGGRTSDHFYYSLDDITWVEIPFGTQTITIPNATYIVWKSVTSYTEHRVSSTSIGGFNIFRNQDGTHISDGFQVTQDVTYYCQFRD